MMANLSMFQLHFLSLNIVFYSVLSNTNWLFPVFPSPSFLSLSPPIIISLALLPSVPLFLHLSLIIPPNLAIPSLLLLLKGRYRVASWGESGGSSPSSSSLLTPLIWLLSSPWRGWFRPSRAPRIWPNRRTSPTVLWTRDLPKSSSGWVCALGQVGDTPERRLVEHLEGHIWSPLLNPSHYDNMRGSIEETISRWY